MQRLIPQLKWSKKMAQRSKVWRYRYRFTAYLGTYDIYALCIQTLEGFLLSPSNSAPTALTLLTKSKREEMYFSM